MDAQREGNANRGRWLAVAAIALLVGVGGLVAACTGNGTPTGAGTTSTTGPAPTTSAPAIQAGQASSATAAADVLFRGDLQRTGVYRGGGPTEPGEARRFRRGGVVTCEPAVSGDALYFSDDSGYLYSVDIETGRDRWRFKPSGSWGWWGDTAQPPAVSNGSVYWGLRISRDLFALDAQTGRQEWKFETDTRGYVPNGVPTSAAVLDGVVYLGSDDGHLYAVDTTAAATTTTRQPTWTFETGGEVRSAPAIANGTVYFGSADSSFYAVDVATGRERWAFETGGVITASPALSDGVAYVNSNDGYLYALDAATGRELWAFETGARGRPPYAYRSSAWASTAPAVSNGSVYVLGGGGHLCALDAETGGLRWKVAAWGEAYQSSPTVSDGVVYVGSDDARLHGVHARSGESLWTYETGGAIVSSPVVADGVVYVVSDDGYLYAVD